MTKLGALDSSPCALCGRRLRNAVFCPCCGKALCSWVCFQNHCSKHAMPVRRVTDQQTDSKLDPAGEGPQS